MSRPPSAVSLDGTLHCECDARPFAVQCQGSEIVVIAPEVTTGLKILQLFSLRGRRRAAIHRIARLADAATVTVELRVGRHTWGFLGYRTGNGWWGMLGLPPVRLRPHAILASLLATRFAAPSD